MVISCNLLLKSAFSINGDFTTSLGTWSSVWLLSGKIFSVLVIQNFLCCNFCLVPIILLPCTSEKTFCLYRLYSFQSDSHRGHWDSSQAFFSVQLKKLSSLIFSSYTVFFLFVCFFKSSRNTVLIPESCLSQISCNLKTCGKCHLSHLSDC